MEKSSYDLFCEHMQRYEAGERNLNEEERKQICNRILFR